MAIFMMLNSFLTMGWPLYFEGNDFMCKDEFGYYKTCDLKVACKEGRSDEIIIIGKNTLVKDFRLICENGRIKN